MHRALYLRAIARTARQQNGISSPNLKQAVSRKFSTTTQRCARQPSCAKTATNPSWRVTGRAVAALVALSIAASQAQSLVRPLRLDDGGAMLEAFEQSDDERPKMISYSEVQRHTSPDDCWTIIKGQVYDLTKFIEAHPGGEQAILEHAGKDATETFQTLHPPDAIQTLPAEMLLGPVDPTTLPEPEEKELTEDERMREAARAEMPAAHNLFLLQDFEFWAERVLTGTAWAYYRSASDEEQSEFRPALRVVDEYARLTPVAYLAFYENRNAFQRYFFRPRILRDTSTGSTESSFLGLPTSMPVFISPAAMAKLGHPLGEVNLTRAAGESGIVQVISSNASCSLEEIFDARTPDQNLIFQLYLNRDRSASEKLIQKVEKLGAKAIMFTVDVCWQSKRTMDVRTKATPGPSPSAPSSAPKGVSQAISGYQDTNLTWKDIPFIRSNTKLPIIVKGVQSLEDVEMCVRNGVEGVVISNHGGRQADYAPAPIDILYEIRCHRPDLFSKIDIMIDGGIRSGADVVKALALGAKAVGIGRPVLYANGTHGQEGCSRVLSILREEITNTMRNIGVTRIEELKPEMVGPAGPWVGGNRPPYAPVPQMKN